MSSRDYVGKSKNKRNDDGKNVASTVDDFLSSDPTESPTDEERRQLSARKESSIEDDLARFRDNWKQEIENKTDQVKEKTNKKSKNKKIVRKSQDSSQNQSDEVDSSSSDFKSSAIDVEREAMLLFKRGIQLENSSKLYDAVACYRRATQLVPDIESKIYALEMKSSNSSNIRKNSKVNTESIKDDALTDGDDTDLISKFSQLCMGDEGSLLLCEPLVQTNSKHFSHLPCEIVMLILRWVVSDQLDLRALEQFGSVCRGFYLLSRDPEIWRLACLKVWSITSVNEALLADYGGDWRRIYVENPRANLNGAYISKATYIRQGEASFQDVNYRPCYLVEYYRYLRFFPEGVVLMLNTPEDPNQSVSKLRHIDVNHSSVVKGHYRIQGSNITAVLKTRLAHIDKNSGYGKRAHQRNNAPSEREYHLKLEIRDFKRHHNMQLVWLSYTVIFRRSTGEETTSTFDLNVNKFPPFWFSRVKSYSSTSYAPLA